MSQPRGAPSAGLRRNLSGSFDTLRDLTTPVGPDEVHPLSAGPRAPEMPPLAPSSARRQPAPATPTIHAQPEARQRPTTIAIPFASPEMRPYSSRSISTPDAAVRSLSLDSPYNDRDVGTLAIGLDTLRVESPFGDPPGAVSLGPARRPLLAARIAHSPAEQRRRIFRSISQSPRHAATPAPQSSPPAPGTGPPQTVPEESEETLDDGMVGAPLFLEPSTSTSSLSRSISMGAMRLSDSFDRDDGKQYPEHPLLSHLQQRGKRRSSLMLHVASSISLAEPVAESPSRPASAAAEALPCETAASKRYCLTSRAASGASALSFEPYAASSDLWERAHSHLRRHRCRLPVLDAHGNKRHINNAISAETAAAVLRGTYREHFDHVVLLDCRFVYEYNGGSRDTRVGSLTPNVAAGHIRSAVNITTKEEVDALLFSDAARMDAGKRTAILLHCEFSSERGPRWCAPLASARERSAVRTTGRG
jgi:hypothetical protein